MLSRLSLRVRATALFPLAALGVHDGFYRLSAGHGGASAHGYLALVEPAAGALAALVLAALVARLLRAWRSGVAGEPGFSGPRLWAVASVGLLAVFAAQECLEALAAGHPFALLAPGGWRVLPLVLAAGGLLTLLLRGAHAATVAVARRARRARARPARSAARASTTFSRPSPAPLALGAAGRAPPSVA